MATTLHLTIPVNESELAGCRAQLREFLGPAGLHDAARDDLVLAVDEAVSNVILHGHPDRRSTIEIFATALPQGVEIRIRDFGAAFDPTVVEPPALPPTRVGGIGVHLIRTLVDNMEYRRDPSGANELILLKLRAR